MMSAVVQTRDILLLRALVFCVRFLSIRLVAAYWGGVDLANARRRLRKLTECGLIESRCIVAGRPPRDIATPLCTWRIGQTLPDAGKVSWHARKRYRKRPLRKMTVFAASQCTHLRFGSNLQRNSARGKALQSSHDLAVGALWVAYATHWPRLARAWLGEDQFNRDRDAMVEDAVIVAKGKPILGIEVGHYRKDRFEKRFHDFYSRNLPFRCH